MENAITVCKFRCNSVAPAGQGVERINMATVWVPNEENELPEDKRFSTMTPSGDLSICIANPAVLGKIVSGKKYYVWISEAPE